MEENIPLEGTPGLKYMIDTETGEASFIGFDEEFPPNYSNTIYIASIYQGHLVKTIKSGAIKNNQNIIRLYIPDSIIRFENKCINTCPMLNYIRFPKYIDYMHNEAIYDCRNLKEVYIEKGNDIRNNAFNKIGSVDMRGKPIRFYVDSQTNTAALIKESSCIEHITANYWCISNLTQNPSISKLTSVCVLPDSRQQLSQQYKLTCFYNCPSLKTVTFKKEVAIGFTPYFGTCPKLRTIYFEAPPEFKGSCSPSNFFGAGIKKPQITIYANWNEKDTPQSFKALSRGIQVVYNDSKPSLDYDFIGFTFNGKHSIKDLSIYRVSQSSRYDLPLGPSTTEEAKESESSNLTHYFSSSSGPQTFTINFAFENLKEDQIRQIKKTFNGQQVGELIFDEWPYKAYEAKVTGTPTYQFMCFEKDGINYYSGQGSLTFTCFYPYAHTPINKSFFIDDYSITNYPTIVEWQKNAGLAKYQNFLLGQNYGERSAPFKLTYYAVQVNKTIDDGDGGGNDREIIPSETKIWVGDNFIITKEECYAVYWDSKTGIVEGMMKDYTIRQINYEGNALCSIPINQHQNIDFIGPQDMYKSGYNYYIRIIELDYQFWYY